MSQVYILNALCSKYWLQSEKRVVQRLAHCHVRGIEAGGPLVLGTEGNLCYRGWEQLALWKKGEWKEARFCRAS